MLDHNLCGEIYFHAKTIEFETSTHIFLLLLFIFLTLLKNFLFTCEIYCNLYTKNSVGESSQFFYIKVRSIAIKLLVLVSPNKFDEKRVLSSSPFIHITSQICAYLIPFCETMILCTLRHFAPICLISFKKDSTLS